MYALSGIIFLLSVTVCFTLRSAVEKLDWYDKECKGGCNTFFGPVFEDPLPIHGYCPKGERCARRYNFYLTLKRCCDDVSFHMMAGNDVPRVDYYNSVLVMYGYYVLDHFQAKDIANVPRPVIDVDVVKDAIIPIYPTKVGDYFRATVLYALADNSCVKRTYKLVDYTWDEKYLPFSVYTVPSKSRAEEKIDCSVFNKAKVDNECLDCFEYTPPK